MEFDWNAVLARATREGEAEYQGLVASLRAKWPELRGIPQQPELYDSYPRGRRDIVGRHDYDSETRTFRTLLADMTGVGPFFYRGAYVVRETDRSDVLFIGRLPLPTWARAWNAFVVLAVGAVVMGVAVSVWRAFRGVW